MSRVEEALRRRERQADPGARPGPADDGPATPKAVEAEPRDTPAQPQPQPGAQRESVESMIHGFVADFQKFVKEWNGE